MAWLDSHTHINDEAFDDDINEVIQRMIDAKVKKAMIVCLNEGDFRKALNITSDQIEFDIALGVYPGDVKEFSKERVEKILSLLEDSRVKAIGEIGLDYYWDKDNKDAQKEIFIRQIEIAERLNKPIIVHSRNAIQDTYDILKAHRVKGVMHCYSDSKEMAKEFIKLGMYISLSGTVTFKNAKEPKEVAKIVPLDRLLIETDCPYLTPVPHRGKRNEPAYVVHTGQYIAELLKMDEDELQKRINENYDNLFRRQ